MLVLTTKNKLTMTETIKPGKGFKIIAILGLLWNLVGVFFWAAENFMMTEEVKAAMPPERLELMESAPSWGVIVYGIATIGGVLACILLLMRKKGAVLLFLLSLLAIIIQMGYGMFVMKWGDILGPVDAYVMPIIVIIIGIFLYMYSKNNAQKGVLS
ncbi:hypothetical protein SAMN06265376_11047 [Dokdonia pacifica]|uniref:Sugar transporter n=2 Tax=Dokdonia pacifica TaxID=1627892 RepID=A0A239D8S6_9FLAO|nr:hypothetical protein SAMN06265376_11047 [Dokdonia pacifica]